MSLMLDKKNAEPRLEVISGQPTTRTTQTVTTTRFGTLEAEEDLIIAFPEGMIGFERCTRFIVVCQDDQSAFRWLQSMEEPGVAFPIIEPREFRPDYAPNISDSDARSLSLTNETPTLVFAVVTIPSNNPRGMTANLLGPLVINATTRIGKQVVTLDQGYTTRHEIVEELARAAAQSANQPKTGTAKAA